ncbi:hypothetical protein [Cognataquiflexum aquatile]|uniref:hypothetical protein n=1 Tax=Cognataquiflexum aquatile TaxID=2249427 RepID=UPI001300A57E|nr:hypothetical protein [Cognataquiflexum aquatile]
MYQSPYGQPENLTTRSRQLDSPTTITTTITITTTSKRPFVPQGDARQREADNPTTTRTITTTTTPLQILLHHEIPQTQLRPFNPIQGHPTEYKNYS